MAPPQPWPIRLAHWVNLPLLVILAGSGLQILVAYPEFGPRGASYGWYPAQGWIPPGFLRWGGWLAGARALHFASAWFFVLNGLGYAIYLAASGEFRRRLFWPRRDAKGAWAAARSYLRGRNPPQVGLYNPLQRLAYTSALFLGLMATLSGLAIWKPLQLRGLATLLGGYDLARVLHLGSLAALTVFTLGHLAMVATHPRTLVSMVTGGRSDEPLPEDA
jgi:thiosulfate reductase cytochrome b subunit